MIIDILNVFIGVCAGALFGGIIGSRLWDPKNVGGLTNGEMIMISAVVGTLFGSGVACFVLMYVS